VRARTASSSAWRSAGSLTSNSTADGLSPDKELKARRSLRVHSRLSTCPKRTEAGIGGLAA
jgi:hypothetical protein